MAALPPTDGLDPSETRVTPREMAHRYRDLGWHVVLADGKVPLHPWKSGGLRTHDAIDAAFTRWPHANVGIATGPSGLVVLDGDEWREPLRGLEAELGALDWSGAAITGSGRLHLYFVAPNVTIRTRAPICIYGMDVPGLDVRAGGLAEDSGGGFIVAPGSRHPDTGAAYEWAPDGFEIPATLPQLPAAWIDGLTRKPEPKREAAPPLVVSGERSRRYAEAVLRGAASDFAALGPGSRHERLLRTAHRLGGYVPAELSSAEIVDALLAACRANGHIEDGEHYCRKTILDGIRAGSQLPHRGAA